MDIKKIYWAKVDKYWTTNGDYCSDCIFCRTEVSHHPYQEGYAAETTRDCIATTHCPAMDLSHDMIAEEIFNHVKDCDNCQHCVGHIDDQTCLVANGDEAKCPVVTAAGF